MAKIYEIAFQLAGKLGSNFASTFLSASKTINNMDGQIRKLTSSQAKITRFQGLKQELIATGYQFQVAQNKVKALENEMKSAEQPTKALEKAFAKAKSEVAKLQDKLTEQHTALSKARTEMTQTGISVTNLASQHKKLSSEISRLKSQKDTYAELQAHAGKFKSSVVSSFKSVSIAAGACTAAVAGYTATAMSFANKAMDAAAKARAGAKLGFGVEQYQELTYAAKVSGVAVDDFDNCMKKMVINLAKADKGTDGKDGKGGLAGQLKQIGLSTKELNGMAPDQAVMKITEALQSVQDPAEKTRLAIALFGKEGMNMMPMLKQGKDGIQNFRDEARKMGLVLDEQTVKQAKTYGLVKKQFANVMDGAKLTIGSALLPVLTTGAEQLMSLLKANQGDIKIFSAQFANGLRQVIPYAIQLIKSFKEIASVSITVVKGAALATNNFKLLSFVIGGIIAYKAAFAFYSMGKNMIAMGQDTIKLIGILRQAGFAAMFVDARMRAAAIATKAWAIAQAALNLVMSINPIALIVIAALALGAAAYYVITHWEQVKAWMAPFVNVILAGWNVIKAAMSGDWEGVLAAIRSFVDSVKNLFMPLFNWISEKWNSIKSTFSSGSSGGGGVDISMPQHAEGGIFNREHIARFAEGGKPEAAIPLSSGNRARGLSLWAQAGQMLGVGGGTSSAQSSGGNTFIYSPTNNFGNASPKDIEPALARDRAEFERQMEAFEAQKRRVSYV